MENVLLGMLMYALQFDHCTVLDFNTKSHLFLMRCISQEDVYLIILFNIK